MSCIFILLQKFLDDFPRVTYVSNTLIKETFLLSFTHVMVEELIFLGQIFEMKILMDLHVMRSL